MKKIILAITTLLMLVGCNVVKMDDRYIEVEVPESSKRTVLLMDFTGWRCVNCPDAAAEIGNILEIFPEQCIAVSMHPEGHAFTEPGSEGPYFASEDAMEYLKAFGGSNSTGLPSGVVDMTEYSGKYLIDAYSKWSSAVLDRMSVPTYYAMEVETEEDTYSVSIDLTSGEATGNERLLVWLVEDSIVAPQLTKSGEESAYMHRHVFRQCINGKDIWGEELGKSFAEAGTIILSDQFDLPELQGEHFVIVAVLVDGDTHEVLQAAETVVGMETPKNPGEFTIKDGENEVEYHDGDTIHVTLFNKDSWEMMWEGYINIDDQSDVDFYVDEERQFDDKEHMVSLCILGLCRPDANKGHWGPFEMKKGQSYDFQSHVMLTEEELASPQTFTTVFTFSNGNPKATKKLVVIYEYTPTGN